MTGALGATGAGAGGSVAGAWAIAPAGTNASTRLATTNARRTLRNMAAFSDSGETIGPIARVNLQIKPAFQGPPLVVHRPGWSLRDHPNLRLRFNLHK
jgi:hypothetical protein